MFWFSFSSQGHVYCKECIQRASEVAIGDGKTELKCLIHCESTFDLSTLQKALGAHTFSKWMKKIQLAEVEKVIVNANYCRTVDNPPKRQFFH